MIAALAAAATGGGCRHAEPRVPAIDAAVALVPDAASYAVARPAIRCAECHGKMYAEWSVSAHARAETSPLYRAMRAQAPRDVACDRCHTPLAGVVEPGDPVVDEGVTCEVCHSIAAVDEDRAGARFEMRLADNVQRGTICDARDHYFHKMGCSPLHGEARLCAACHQLRLGDVPVFTEVESFRAGPYADLLECQDCHMPESVAEVAEGSPPREGVGHHGFLGTDGRLFARALTGKLRARRVAGGVEVQVTVKNANAGHAVPGGLPGRQIILRVSAVDARGAALARGERVYQRLLVGDSGAPAPFYLARREASDNRLQPREARVEIFALGGVGVRRVRLEVLRRELAPELAVIVGQPLPEEQLLVRAEVAPGGATDWQQ